MIDRALQINNLNAFALNKNNVPRRQKPLGICIFCTRRLALLHDAGIPLHVIDLRDYQMIGALIHDLRPDAIVHLAAVAHANEADRNPFSTFNHSLHTLENTLDCVRLRNDCHFIYFSSSQVYGTFSDDAVTETARCEPVGIYGALKVASEKIVIAYNQVFKVPYTIVRPSALYGERCVSRRVGQIFIENALQGLDLEVVGNGSDPVELTYVNDAVNGVVRIIERPESRGEVFNLACGELRSRDEIVMLLREHFPDIRVKYSPREKLTSWRGTLSIEKARRLLNFEPQYPIEKGFPKYIDWYKDLFARRANTIAPLAAQGMTV